MGWFTKKLEESIPAKPANGFFSTDSNIRSKTIQDAIEQDLPKSFQINPTKMKAYASDGQEITNGMDEQYCDLQLVKSQNAMMSCLPIEQIGWYASQGFIGYQLCAMISQHWLVNKACSIPARDAVRHGWELATSDGKEIRPEILDYINKKDKQFSLKKNCVEFIRMGRIFGIRVAMFKIDSPDPEYYAKPFNIDGVMPGSYKGISQIDPYWITPELDAASAADPSSIHFYEPTWWRINGKRVHRTHLIIMRNGGELPDVLKPTYYYGGVPLAQMIAERIYAAERTANEAPMLAMSKRLTVLSTDVTKALSNLPAFSQKMQSWTEVQNNFGVKVVGEDEKIAQYDTSLADLDEAIMTQYQLVAAIAETPATKLLGTSPKGFGASGDYEESSYHESLESLQEHDLTPLIDRHHMLIIKSDVAPKFKVNPFMVDITWKPTDSPTAKEQAELNLMKAQTDTQLVQSGSIDSLDARGRIVADPDSGYTGIELIVPGGPGDREAQQEAEAAGEQSLEAGITAKGKQTSSGEDEDNTLQNFHFDPVAGTLNGARLITHQKYLDKIKIAEKIVDKDFMVNVTPEFYDDGKKYRMIIDGHHSLAAAVASNVHPIFETGISRSEIINAVTGQATDGNE